jgi:lysyl-tRNA synthetase, class II
VTDRPVDPVDPVDDASPGSPAGGPSTDASAGSPAGGPFTDASAGSPAGESKLDEIIAGRRAKVAALRDAGIEPYPVRFRPTATLAEVRDAYPNLEPGAATGEQVTVAGRLVAKREMGKLRFLVLREDGVDLQLFCPVKALDEASRELIAHLDVGDWVGASGEVMASQKGELSVKPATLTLLGKGLRPLPDKWHGLTDTEARFRQREVDLVVNPEARRVFEVRSAVLKALRAEMDERGFVEVETPMLHPIPGGATAKPFVTHHNTLDTDLYLRIAPELYLKRLIAGGMRRVYEINRNFRNEGMSSRHNPEFTMLESYAAYDDYHDVMELTEALLQRAALEAVGTLELSYQGRAVSLAGPFRRASLLSLTRDASGRPELSYDLSVSELRAICDAHDVPWDEAFGPGKLVLELFEKLVEPNLWDPTLVLDYPVEVSPLARKHRSEPHVTERFELIATGRELANAFSELIDPADQRGRFEAQARAKAAGDEEAMVLDEPYLRAMELGLPPTGGLGLGVDRVVMLLADVANIRDVILFPTLRPERA